MSISLDSLIDSAKIWQANHTPTTGERTSSQHQEVDELLVGGGFQNGTLTEVLYQQEGSGELRLLMPLLAKLSQRERWILWVAPPCIPYAPALEQAGVDLSKILMAHPKNNKEVLWAMEQGLKNGNCSAVLGWPGNISSAELRRLQLAASSSDTLAFIFRDPCVSQQHSPASVRVHLSPVREGTNVKILKRRGAWPVAREAMDLGQAALLNPATMQMPEPAALRAAH